MMKYLSAGLLAIVCSWLGSCSGAERPNIVFILADDLGIGDVNCYGGSRCQIDTPHIDSLAAAGVRFTDAHVNASVCVPTRVGIMTGRYPWRFGRPEAGGPWGFLGLQFSPETFTLGDLLKSAGYQTCYIGKWHLGTRMATRNGEVQNIDNVDYRTPLKIGPRQFGFDESFILPGSLDMYPYAFARNNVWQGNVTARKGWSAFNRVGPAEESFEDHQVLATLYGEAEQFLDRQGGTDPFFMFLALTAPHTPTSPGEKFRGKSRLGIYGDFVSEVDDGVRRIVERLKKNSLNENTLVIFGSDHGAAPYAGRIAEATPGQLRDLEQDGHFSSGPHRGYKFSVYEGGLRIPLIAAWPGRIPAGVTCDRLIGTNDLMATFGELAGMDAKENQAVDSISFASLLTNPSGPATRKDLIMQSVGPFVVRKENWKLCLCPGSGASGKLGNERGFDEAWTDALKAHGRPNEITELYQAPFVQLYDLSTDLHEDHDLSAERPDKVAELIALLRTQISAGRSTPGKNLTNDRPVNILQRVPQSVLRKLEKP